MSYLKQVTFSHYCNPEDCWILQSRLFSVDWSLGEKATRRSHAEWRRGKTSVHHMNVNSSICTSNYISVNNCFIFILRICFVIATLYLWHWLLESGTVTCAKAMPLHWFISVWENFQEDIYSSRIGANCVRFGDFFYCAPHHYFVYYFKLPSAGTVRNW